MRPPRRRHSRCAGNCVRCCAAQFDGDRLQAIHSAFWRLSEAHKDTFYGRFTERLTPKRVRTKAQVSRKAFTYRYYFETASGERRQVCQLFFSSTLDISKQRVYRFFNQRLAGAAGGDGDDDDGQVEEEEEKEEKE